MTTSPTTCRVGICDDVADFRRVIGIMLRAEQGVEVVGEAGNGQEAIDLVTSTAIDVLVLDVAMPVMDGLEALPSIRKASPSTRVVMFTGFGSPAVRRQAEELGAYAYIDKGTGPAELIAAITGACGDGDASSPGS